MPAFPRNAAAEPAADASLPQVGPSFTGYLCIRGHAHVTPTLAARFLDAALLDRLVYNAAVDRRTAFSAGVTHGLARSRAWRDRTDAPSAPERSDRYLPVPQAHALDRELTSLRGTHPELASVPFSMLLSSINDACAAVQKHVAACVAAKTAGHELPRLHFRSARDTMTVTTSSSTLRRVGMGQPRVAPKFRGLKKSTWPTAHARCCAKPSARPIGRGANG